MALCSAHPAGALVSPISTAEAHNPLSSHRPEPRNASVPTAFLGQDNPSQSVCRRHSSAAVASWDLWSF